MHFFDMFYLSGLISPFSFLSLSLTILLSRLDLRPYFLFKFKNIKLVSIFVRRKKKFETKYIWREKERETKTTTKKKKKKQSNQYETLEKNMFAFSSSFFLSFNWISFFLLFLLHLLLLFQHKHRQLEIDRKWNKRKKKEEAIKIIKYI